MTKKQILILSVIFGFLALGILLKTGVRVFREDNRVVMTKVIHLTPSSLDQILLGKGSERSSIELVKENGVWKVKSLWNAKADFSKISDLLGKLELAMRTQEPRGKGKNLFPDFGITDQDAFSLKFVSANKTLMDLRLGVKKSGEGYFIRKTGDDSVYFIETDMAGLLGIYADFEKATPSSAFWADLSLFNLDPEKVTKIAVFRMKGDEKAMAAGLERETDPKDPAKSSWKFLRESMTSVPDPEKILRFIATLSSIKAKNVVDPAGKEYGLGKPVWQLVVTEGNKETILDAGPKNEKEGIYFVRASSDASVFSLGATYFDDMNVDDTHFMKDAPAAAEPKKSS